MATMYDMFNCEFEHYHRYFRTLFSGFLKNTTYDFNVLFDEKTNLIKIEMFREDRDNVMTLFIQSDKNQNLPNGEWLAIVQLMMAVENRAGTYYENLDE